MKRIRLLCAVMFAAYVFAPLTVIAETDKPPTGVSITVVMPDTQPEPTETNPAETQPEKAPAPVVAPYPSNVVETQENGKRQIIKTYELRPEEHPEHIPRDAFDRDGWRYTLADITRQETAAAETRPHVETVTVHTDTQALEQILPSLAPTMEYVAEDGFAGILTLDISTIKTGAAGTKTSRYTLSVTREYPRLSGSDLSLVPKTVTEKGKTYTLADVQWRAGNISAVDYEELPEYYTAVAKYTATGTTTKVTGYTTTAEYKGDLTKLSQGHTLYTAYFIGEKIIPERIPLGIWDAIPGTAAESSLESDTELTAESETEIVAELDGEATNRPGALRTWLSALLPTLGAVGGVAVYFVRKKRKEEKNNEKDGKETNNPASAG
jgi:hypothetical protein